jgi:hypothetical protein
MARPSMTRIIVWTRDALIELAICAVVLWLAAIEILVLTSVVQPW